MKNPNSLPFLNKGEETLLFNSGLFKSNSRSGWKPGHLYLTTKKVNFFSTSQNLFPDFTGEHY